MAFYIPNSVAILELYHLTKNLVFLKIFKELVLKPFDRAKPKLLNFQLLILLFVQ